MSSGLPLDQEPSSSHVHDRPPHSRDASRRARPCGSGHPGGAPGHDGCGQDHRRTAARDAPRLSLLDNDEAVRAMTGREPAEIRDTDGEAALHRLESAALGWALGGPPPMIVGAAGGSPRTHGPSQLLGRDTTVVWLRATPETLQARIGGGRAGASRRPTSIGSPGARPGVPRPTRRSRTSSSTSMRARPMSMPGHQPIAGGPAGAA